MLRGGRDPVPAIMAAYEKSCAAIATNKLEAEATLAKLDARLAAYPPLNPWVVALPVPGRVAVDHY